MARRAPKLPAGFGAKLKALIHGGRSPREAMRAAWRHFGKGKGRGNPRTRVRITRAKFCPERVAPPSRFDPRSFRMVKVKGHRVVVGCPKGHFHRGRCKVGTQAQKILHPAGERDTCALPGREVKRRNPVVPGLKAIVEDIYEGKSHTPTLRHVFFGKTEAEARAVRLAHAKSDSFLAAAIRGASFRGIPLRAEVLFSNPLTRKETAQVVRGARIAHRLGRRRTPPSLTAPAARDPEQVAAHRGWWFGQADAFAGVAQHFGAPGRGREAVGRKRRLSSLKRKSGPAAALGTNPPRGATEVYGRVLEIKAQKGRRSRYAGKRYVHRFSHGGPILGLPGGKLLIAGAK